MKEKRREIEVVVLSDVHLGTFGCHAKELYFYLKSIQTKKLILNGDIIDMWQFSKRYWPKSHMLVVKQIMSMLAHGVEVYYVTGNHDEMLRKFTGFSMGSFHIVNKMILRTEGKKIWIFHGDVFDVTMRYSKWLAKLGGFGYDLLIVLNRAVNLLLKYIGREKISFSKKIKNGVKGALTYINSFENTVADIAIENRYDVVICGHIHKPDMRIIGNSKGSVMYMNPGDWIENLTSLEYTEGQWKLYKYEDDSNVSADVVTKEEYQEIDNHTLFQELLDEIKVTPKRAARKSKRYTKTETLESIL